MEFLQKLISIPKNVLLSLKYSQQKKQQIEVIEPIKFVEDCKIETFDIMEQKRVIKKKLIADKQIQTELEFVRTIENSQKKCLINRDDNKQSHQFKKNEKCAKKQAQSPSEASDKTKPSQYSYCQNNLIDSFELDEKQRILQNDRFFYTAQKRTVEQAQQRFLDNYFNKIKLQLEDKEQLIMKQNIVKTNN